LASVAAMHACAPSMDSVGDCIDSAMYESFFATLEFELLDRCHFDADNLCE
jgi:hypothetical protein